MDLQSAKDVSDFQVPHISGFGQFSKDDYRIRFALLLQGGTESAAVAAECFSEGISGFQ